MESFNSEAYLEPYEISEIELFAKMVNDWKLLITFAKSSILDVRQGSENEISSV